MTMRGILLAVCCTIGLTCNLMLGLELCFLVRPNSAIKTLSHPQEADISDYLHIRSTVAIGLQEASDSNPIFSKVIQSKHSNIFQAEILHSSSVSRSSEIKDFLNKIVYRSKDRVVVTEEQHASSRRMLHSMGSKTLTLPLQLNKNIIQLLHQNKFGLDIFESTKPRGFRRTSDATSRTIGYISLNAYLAHNIQRSKRGIFAKDILNKEGVKSELRSVRSLGQLEDFRHILKESSTQPKYARIQATITKRNHILNTVDLHYIDRPTYKQYSIVSTQENIHKNYLKNGATIVRGKEDNNNLSDHIVGGLLSLKNFQTDMEVLDIREELSEHVTFQKTKQGRLSSQELLPSNALLSKELTVVNVTDGVSQSELEIVNQEKIDLEPTKDITFPARLLDILIRNVDELYSITDSSFTMYHEKHFGSKDVDEILGRGIPGIEWRQSGLQRWLKPVSFGLGYYNIVLYLRHGGYVFIAVCLPACIFVCYKDYAKTNEWILIKYSRVIHINLMKR
ncbi:uncharacterized protein LOC117105658 [Anneissia japonica]|uniref:uncharacterized protein LOC117105658 n=1 Tax=Anneissia japonica TaxID=1529436 RepID=UPI0014254D2D|nr:uncharacterized protein LOC117105658 [Anneissia japonica]